MATSAVEQYPKTKHIVILGGGPSGLGTALGIRLNMDSSQVTVVEKEERAGGLAGSFFWKDHIIDYGPHRLSPNLENVKVLAEELLSSDCLIKKSQHGVQFRGKLYQFPPRVSDWILPKSMWYACRFALSLFASQFIWITKRFTSDTFESTIVRKFGRLFYHWVVIPMAEKVWAHPDEIDPSFVNQRFSMLHPWQVLKKTVFPKQELNPSNFFYPKKGFQQLWSHMADYVEREGADVLFSWWPEQIEVKNGRITRLLLSDGIASKTIEGPDLTVVSTIPIAALLRVLKGHHEEALIKRASALKHRSMVLVAFELDQPETLPFRVLMFPEKQYIFNRLYEQNAYSRATVSEGRSVIVADVTRCPKDEFLQLSHEEIIERVKKDLSKLSYIPVNRIVDAHVERVEFAYVVPSITTRDSYKTILHELKKIHNLHLLGRFATGEYDNSDFALESGLSLGKLISRRISKLDYLLASHNGRNKSIVG